MSNRLSVIFSLLFLCLAAALPARGRTARSDIVEEKDNIVQVTGVVRLVGNSPFQTLVITGQDREWHIEKEEENLLKDLQQMTVFLEGEETVSEMKFANGLSAGERRTIKNIKIIAVQSPQFE